MLLPQEIIEPEEMTLRGGCIERGKPSASQLVRLSDRTLFPKPPPLELHLYIDLRTVPSSKFNGFGRKNVMDCDQLCTALVAAGATHLLVQNFDNFCVNLLKGPLRIAGELAKQAQNPR